MIYVGIDTGVNTGFAVWDSKQRSLLQVCSLPIHKAMERVRSLYDEYKAGIGDKVIVRVEDPRQRTWFGTERMSREMERKKLQGVGSVKRDASIWDDYLKELGTDGQMYSYTFDVFLPSYFEGDLSIGARVEVTLERGGVDEFTISGIDDTNPKYIEIWG